MDRLRRQLAPVTDAAWEQIDEEAARSLRQYLAGRPLVDFSGPRGWSYSSHSKGLVEPATSPVDGVRARARVVQPAIELKVPFTLDLAELDRVDRGSTDPDLDPVSDAAKLAALAEDRTIFGGGPAGLSGLVDVSPHDPVAITDDYGQYPGLVARAVASLRRAGIEGPYAIALGERCYTGVVETTEHGGYPVLQHIRLILGGPVVWAPAVDGAVVISMRGGDYEFISGSDFAIGYTRHDDSQVELFLEESFVFLVHEPRAAVALRYL